jgi:signal transduction histidine kinase
MSMNRTFWLMRFAAYVVIGLLALVNPPHSHPQRAVQIACFSVIGAALLACVFLDLTPRYAARGLPVALSVMAIFGGLAAVTSGSGQTLIVFAAIAAVAAGSDIAMPVPIVVALAGMIPIWIAGPFTHSTLGTMGGYPVLIVSCLLWGRNRRSYRVQAEQAAALLEQSERTRAEQRRADVLDERARIAREIHDVLAHSLGALGIQIQSAKAMLTDRGDIEHAVEALSTAQRIAADGLAETRRAVHALRVDALPLDEELAGVVETHRQRYRVPVTFETTGEIRQLPPDASLALLRAGQEALVNAAKHAPGQQVAVQLNYTATGIRLSVVNHLNGAAAVPAGRKPGITGGYGLTGMRERLRLLNGTLQAGPRDDAWAVTAELPLPAAAPSAAAAPSPAAAPPSPRT